MQKTPSPTVDANRHHFATDHLLANLKQRTISSGVVRVAAQGVQFVLTFSYNIVLARLLTPADFGLVAMVMTVLGFLQIFRDMGLSTATIQRADITHAQVSNLFWLNVGVSGLISLLIALSSPLFTWFYHEPKLLNITLALSVYFILNGLAVQHLALLNRQMRFKVISAIEVGSMAGGIAMGVVMAVLEYGYWSLVAATLATAILRLVFIWMASGWRPQRPVRGVGTRPLVSFGASLTVSGLIYSVSRGCDTLFIGKFFGTEAVGLYSRAAALVARPMEQVIDPIYAVIVPALSRLQGNPERYRRFYLCVFEAMAIAGYTFTGLFFPVADSITVTILGAKWAEAGPFFAILSTAAIFTPLSVATSWLFTSQGRGKDQLQFGWIVAIMMVLALLVGVAYGPLGVAVAFAVSGLFIRLPFCLHYAGKSGPVTSRDLWGALFRPLPIGLAVAVVTWLAHETVTNAGPVKQLLVALPLGAVTAVAMVFALPASRHAVLRIVDAVREMKAR